MLEPTDIGLTEDKPSPSVVERRFSELPLQHLYTFGLTDIA